MPCCKTLLGFVLFLLYFLAWVYCFYTPYQLWVLHQIHVIFIFYFFCTEGKWQQPTWIKHWPSHAKSDGRDEREGLGEGVNFTEKTGQWKALKPQGKLKQSIYIPNLKASTVKCIGFAQFWFTVKVTHLHISKHSTAQTSNILRFPNKNSN